MYHQFDRTMHPRQSILKHILGLRESNRELERTANQLEAVRPCDPETISSLPSISSRFLSASLSPSLFGPLSLRDAPPSAVLSLPHPILSITL